MCVYATRSAPPFTSYLSCHCFSSLSTQGWHFTPKAVAPRRPPFPRRAHGVCLSKGAGTLTLVALVSGRPPQATLPSGTSKVRFVAVAGSSYTGDMSIDSVVLSNKAPSKTKAPTKTKPPTKTKSASPVPACGLRSDRAPHTDGCYRRAQH